MGFGGWPGSQIDMGGLIPSWATNYLSSFVVGKATSRQYWEIMGASLTLCLSLLERYVTCSCCEALAWTQDLRPSPEFDFAFWLCFACVSSERCRTHVMVHGPNS